MYLHCIVSLHVLAISDYYESDSTISYSVSLISQRGNIQNDPTDFQDAYVGRVYVCIGDEVTSSNTGISYEVAELGLLQTKQIPQERL